MAAGQRFTIQLANGKEEAFATAAAMVQWIDRQRGLEVPKRKRRSQKAAGPSGRKTTRQVQAASERPLARYANRLSGEA